MMPPRVIVEDERMKYPYTGLFTFCEQLSKSLVKNQQQTQAELSFYVPENQVGFLVSLRQVRPGVYFILCY
jgi:hypothetical protein